MGAMFWVTIKEAMRKRTFLIMSIVTVLYLAFYAVALYFFKENMGPSNSAEMIASFGAELVATAGINFSQSLVIFLTVMLGAGTISVDIESGLIHGILSRPLSRNSYVAGKVFGLFALCGVFSMILYGVVLALGNFFGFDIVRTLDFWKIAGGLGYYLMSPAAMLCLIMLCGLRLRTIPNGILALFIFIIGSIGGTVEQVGRFLENASLETIGLIVSLISPFNAISGRVVSTLMPPSSDIAGNVVELMSGSGAGLPGLWMVVYLVGYVALAYGLTIYFFQKKDIA